MKFLLGVSILFTVEANAQSNKFTVTNTNDDGAGSLRQAIIDANLQNGTDFISFENNVSGTITLKSKLNITDAVNIYGPGSNILTISGNNTVQLFTITQGIIHIHGLSLKNGLSQGGDGQYAGPSGGGGGAGLGGAIAIDNANVFIQDVIFDNNKAKGGSGGSTFTNAIDNVPGGNGGSGPFGSGGSGGFSQFLGSGGGGNNGASLGAGGGGGGGGSGNSIIITGPGGDGNLGGGGGGVGGIGTEGNLSTKNGLGKLFGGDGGIGVFIYKSAPYLTAGGAGGGGAGLGGAIFINNGSLTLQNCVFSNNSSTGGAKGVAPGESKAATNGQGKGGAIFSNTATIAIQNVSYSNNIAANQLNTLIDGNNVYGTTNSFTFKIAKAVNELLYDNFKLVLVGHNLRFATGVSINGKSLTNVNAFACIPDTSKDSLTAILPLGFTEGPVVVTAEGVTNTSQFYIKRIVVPPVVTDLVATAMAPDVIQLSWTNNNTAGQGYKIYKSKYSWDGNYELYDSVGANISIYTDKNARDNYTSFYKISPIYYNYVIAQSAAANATTIKGYLLYYNIEAQVNKERCRNEPFVYKAMIYDQDVTIHPRSNYTVKWYLNGDTIPGSFNKDSILSTTVTPEDLISMSVTSLQTTTIGNGVLVNAQKLYNYVVKYDEPIVSIIPNTNTYCEGKQVGFEALVEKFDNRQELIVKWFVNGKPKYVNENYYNPQYPQLDSLKEGDVLTSTISYISVCTVGNLISATTTKPYIVKFTDGPKFTALTNDTVVNAGSMLQLNVIASDTVPVKYIWEYKRDFNNGNSSNSYQILGYYQDEPYSATKQYATGYNTNTLTLNNVNAKPDPWGQTVSEYRVKATGVCSSYSDFIKVKPFTTISVINSNETGAGSLEDGLATLKSGGVNYNSPYVKVEFAPGLSGTFKISNTLLGGGKSFEMIAKNQNVVLEAKSTSGYMFDLSSLKDTIKFQNIEFSGNAYTAKYALKTGFSPVVLTNCTFSSFGGGKNEGVIYGGKFFITNCKIENNKARGLTIWDGNATISNTLISNNSYGGLYILGREFNNPSHIYNSAIVKNGAAADNYYNGGAIHSDSDSSNLFINNSTISLNNSKEATIKIQRGKVTTLNTTIANNITSWSAVTTSSTGTYSLSNTILVGSRYSNGNKVSDFRTDADGKFITQYGHNIIGSIFNKNEFDLPILPEVDMSDPQNTYVGEAIAGTLVNINAESVIEDSLSYDSLTYIHKLVECSPAKNSGSTLASFFQDQRGVFRFDGKPDIGAYEADNSILIYDYNTPKISIEPVRTELCSFTDTLTFKATVQNAGSKPFVQWYKNGVLADTGLVANFETNIETQIHANVISNEYCNSKNGASSFAPLLIGNSGTYYTLDKDTTVCNAFTYNGTTIEKTGLYPFAIKKNNSTCDSLVVKFNVKFNNPYSYGKFTGTVLKNNAKYASYVYVYKLSDDITILPTLVNQSYSNTGDFVYNYLQWGKYVVLAKPDDYKVADIPTYYGGDYQFQNATIFNVGCETFEYKNLNINIEVLKTLPAGTGSITGTVANGKAAAARIQANSSIKIYLIASPSGDIVGQTLTDANGEFSFTNLPDGDYKTVAEIVGYKSDTSTVFTIGNGSSARISSLCIDPNSPIVGACEKVTNIQENNLFIDISVMPNPSTGIFNLNTSSTNGTVKVVSSLGIEIANYELNSSNTIIDLSNQSNGIYLIQVITEKGKSEVKVVKN